MMGSAVILGHVDDKKGPAVFFRLGPLKAGDSVDVSLANGPVAHFAVKGCGGVSEVAAPFSEG